MPYPTHHPLSHAAAATRQDFYPPLQQQLRHLTATFLAAAWTNSVSRFLIHITPEYGISLNNLSFDLFGTKAAEADPALSIIVTITAPK
jgi:hypothetical protein